MLKPKPRVFLVSTAHPATDPRIVYKECPTLADHYEVICALPQADSTINPRIKFLRLPYFQRVVWRAVLSGPLVLLYGIRLRPAIVQIYVPELIPVALILRLFGARIIYEVQENLYKKLHFKTLNRGFLLEWAFRKFDELARRYCYLIFTEHSYVKTYTNLVKPHVVIYNYPLLSLLEPFRQPYHPIPARPSLILLGLLSLERALDSLVDALSQLKLHYPDFVAHLFGRQTLTDKALQQLPGFAAVRNNLRFYGYTDQRIALTQVANATAGLALLKPIGDYPDSYPTKLFEYMALGLPVITSDFQLYRDVVERHACGICVSANDPAAIANALIYLIEHPKEAQAMGKRGRQAVETTFSWTTESHKLLRFYQTILASN